MALTSPEPPGIFLVSEWQVDDEGSALLMARFFDNVSRGKGRATALHEAQLRVIADRRSGATGTAHPFYWAAFTLTGR